MSINFTGSFKKSFMNQTISLTCNTTDGKSDFSINIQKKPFVVESSIDTKELRKFMNDLGTTKYLIQQAFIKNDFDEIAQQCGRVLSFLSSDHYVLSHINMSQNYRNEAEKQFNLIRQNILKAMRNLDNNMLYHYLGNALRDTQSFIGWCGCIVGDDDDDKPCEHEVFVYRAEDKDEAVLGGSPTGIDSDLEEKDVVRG